MSTLETTNQPSKTTRVNNSPISAGRRVYWRSHALDRDDETMSVLLGLSGPCDLVLEGFERRGFVVLGLAAKCGAGPLMLPSRAVHTVVPSLEPLFLLNKNS
jgi:hypothetical protein